MNIFDSMLKGNFDVYRENYSKMSFQEIQNMHNKWFKVKGSRDSFHFDRIASFMTYIHHPIGKRRYRVFEFGCWSGALAMNIFNVPIFDRNILSYKACDICSSALSACNPSLLKRKKFCRLYLNKPLWDCSNKEFNVKDFDIFLSSHTLEHITDDELRKLLKRIEGVRFLILELPFDSWRKWGKYGGNHMLEISAPEFVELLYQFGYDLLKMIPNTFPKNRKSREARDFLFEYNNERNKWRKE